MAAPDASASSSMNGRRISIDTFRLVGGHQAALQVLLVCGYTGGALIGIALERLDAAECKHDFTQNLDIDALPLSQDARSGKRVVFFPGSTIGNFELIDALALLKTLRGWLRDGDALLIGADMASSRL